MKNLEEKMKTIENIECECKKLNNVIEAADLGTWEWNMESGEVVLNEKWAEMLGYSLEELNFTKLETFIKLIHPEDLKNSNEIIEKHVKGEIEYYDFEMRMKHKDGRWIWFHERGKVIERDEKGKALKMFGTHSDISKRKQIEKEIEENKKRFMFALDETKAGLWEMDMIENKMFLSSTWKKMLGYENDEIENAYESWERLWHPDDKEMIEKTLRDYFEGRSKKYELIHRLKHKDGSWRWILSRGGVLRDNDEMTHRWIGTNLDITAVYEHTLAFERIFSVNLDLLFIVDMDGNFIKINKASCDILGYSEDELKEFKVLDLVHKDYMESTIETFERMKNDEKISFFINRFLHKNGSYRYLEWSANPYEGLIYAAARDVTERIHYEEKILELSNRDSLTGVYNRRYVYERAAEMIEECKRDKRIFSVAILDIDDFKKVNDKYGHMVGDEVLKAFTKIINQNLRPSDILGRYGGEEFIIILNNADEMESRLILNKILKIVREKTFTFEGNDIKFTFSTGISNCKELEKKELIIDKLILMADKRMYRAKNEGKDKIVSKTC